MVDVFISYSRADQAIVSILARAVEAEGYDVWWDAELPPHKSYGDVITEMIGRAKAAIVVWSGEAVKSEWVRAEADMARNQRKLVQTALDGAVPPLPFNQIQYAELTGWRGEANHPGWRKVKASLAELCGAGAEPRGVAMPPPPVQQRPAPAMSASRWPLFAGLGVGVLGLGVAGAVLFNERGEPRQSAAPAAVPAVEIPGALADAPQPVPIPAAAPPALPPEAAPEAAEVAAPVVGASLAPIPARVVARTPLASEERAPVAPNPADMTFPDSSTRVLQPSEVYPLGPSTLKIARNEIFARKGMRFTTPFLRDWFSRFAWYKPRFDTVRLNEIERRNIALIREAEARYQ